MYYIGFDGNTTANIYFLYYWNTEYFFVVFSIIYKFDIEISLKITLCLASLNREVTLPLENLHFWYSASPPTIYTFTLEMNAHSQMKGNKIIWVTEMILNINFSLKY